LYIQVAEQEEKEENLAIDLNGVMVCASTQKVPLTGFGQQVPQRKMKLASTRCK